MLLVRNIRLPLSCGEAEAIRKAQKILHLPADRAAGCGVAKLSVDARHGTPVLVYTIAVTLKDEGEESAYAGASPCVCFTRRPEFSFPRGQTPLAHRLLLPWRHRPQVTVSPKRSGRKRSFLTFRSTGASSF